MQAQFFTNSDGNVTIQLRGGLDYETTSNFHRELHHFIKLHPASLVTLDLYFLDFVGSSGIGSFVESIKSANDKFIKVRLKNVKAEFIKVFKLYRFHNIEELLTDLPLKEDDDRSNLL